MLLQITCLWIASVTKVWVLFWGKNIPRNTSFVPALTFWDFSKARAFCANFVLRTVKYYWIISLFRFLSARGIGGIIFRKTIYQVVVLRGSGTVLKIVKPSPPLYVL